MFCSNCGSKHSDNAKFCANCGNPISTSTPVPAPISPNSVSQYPIGTQITSAQSPVQSPESSKSKLKLPINFKPIADFVVKHKIAVIAASAAMVVLIIIISVISCSATRNGHQFSTEYTIEDYDDGLYIASKLDGRLYGVLDHNGKTVIDFKYDNLKFADHSGKYNLIIGVYEGDCGALNYKGQKIVPFEYDDVFIDLTDGYIQARHGEWPYNNDSYYSFDGEQLTSVNNSSSSYSSSFPDNYFNSTLGLYIDSQHFVPSDQYSESIIYRVRGRSTGYLQQFNGNTIYYYDYYYQFYNETTNELHPNKFASIGNFTDGTAFAQRYNSSGYCLIDTDGNIITDLNVYENSVEMRDKILLCETSGTWKLYNKSGKIIGDSRYYDCKELDYGDYSPSYYALQNDNGQYCVYSENGVLTVPYGHLEYDDGAFIFDNQEVADIFTSSDGICFVTEGKGDSYNVYCYQS